MKNYLRTIALVAILLATPVLAVTENPDTPVSSSDQTSSQTQANYGDNAAGIRERIQALKEARESDRLKLRNEIATVTKKVAARHIDNVIKKYETLKTRVKRMKSISSEQKELLGSKIDAEIAKMRSFKLELATAKSAEEVKNVMDQVRTQARNGLTLVKETVAAIHASHYTNLVERLEKVLASLNKKVVSSKEAGQNVEELEKMAITVRAKIDTANVNISAKSFVEARKNLSDARNELVKMVNALKDLSATDASDTDQNQEVE